MSKLIDAVVCLPLPKLVYRFDAWLNKVTAREGGGAQRKKWDQ
jgi:hypothetical protein